MNTEILSVFDQAAERFMDPFAAVTIEFGLRGFKEACMQDGHQFNRFPEDYALYHVGRFNSELGVIEPLKARKIAMASSFVHNAVEEIG